MFEAFGKLLKLPQLVVIPVVADGFFTLLGIAMHGFTGNSHLTLKLALQMGLPSIGAVAEQGLMPGSVQISGANSMNASSMFEVLFYLALFLFVKPFLQAGYVGCLYEASDGRRLSMERFASYGRRFFGRFLLFEIFVFILFLIGGLLAALLGISGFVLFMLIFLILRVLFLFFEFTLVADDCSISVAFSRSLDAFRQRTAATVLLIGATLIFNFVAGLMVNALWLPFLFLIFMIVYDIVGAGLQVAFMNDYRRIKGQTTQ